MTERLDGSVHGVPVSFDVPAELLAEVRELLPPGWKPGEVPDSAARWAISSVDNAPGQLNAAELYIAEHAPGLIFIHAGVVAFDEAAILLPGRSFSGKSALTHALVRAGGTYYSDEFALLQPDGTVLPYPRPLTLRATEGAAAQRIPVRELPAVGTSPVRPALIAQLQYASDGVRSAADAGKGEAVLALIDNAVAARSRSGEVLQACAAAAANARFVRGGRGEAQDAADRLVKLLDPP